MNSTIGEKQKQSKSVLLNQR